MLREILVIERDPWWAPELMRRFDGRRRIRQVTSTSDVSKSLDATELLVMPLAHQAAAIIQLLDRVRQRRQRVASIVIAEAHQAELECPVRELGATSFLVEPIPGRRLAATVERLTRATAG